MEKKIPLFYKKELVGTIRVESRGSKLCFHAECDKRQDGLFRAYALCSDRPEHKILVGVMEPCGDSVAADKIFTCNDLRDMKISYDSVDTGELMLYNCFSGEIYENKWTACKDPGTLFKDTALRNALSNRKDILINTFAGNVYVAAPIKENFSFGFAPAFCIANVLQISGDKYGVVKVSDSGTPESARLTKI